MQSHMYCAYVQNPHSSVFPGTFLLFSGNQKINLYSNPVFLEHQFAMNAAESATSWILFCNYCKTNNTRAQQMQVSCLRTVNVDFPKSSYKSIFSCNSDAKYFQDGLLQRNFSRADSGWVKCWWNTAEIQCVLLLMMALQSRPMQLPDCGMQKYFPISIILSTVWPRHLPF